MSTTDASVHTSKSLLHSTVSTWSLVYNFLWDEQSIYVCIYLFVYQSVNLSICLSVYSTCLSCLSIFTWFSKWISPQCISEWLPWILISFHSIRWWVSPSPLHVWWILGSRKALCKTDESWGLGKLFQIVRYNSNPLTVKESLLLSNCVSKPYIPTQ